MKRTQRLLVLCALSLAVLCGGSALAESYVREELRIPMAGTPNGLEALLVRLDGSDRRPLALITHGTPRKASDRATFTTYGYWAQAMEFARRGWAAVVLLRRGYGSSVGPFAEASGPCRSPDYYRSGLASAQDLRAAIAVLARRADIDASQTLTVGVSAGGYAAVALTVDPPPGLVAVISFAGGRGSPADGQICREDLLADAFAQYGRVSRVPMLWVYAENDHYFAPAAAREFADAFVKGGGVLTFMPRPAFGEDGHKLFSAAGIPLWTPLVDAFLKERGLVLRATPAALPRPALPAPAALSANGRANFEQYLMAAPHKAFAMTSEGGFSWRAGQANTEKAKALTLEACAQNHRSACRLRFLDDLAVEP